MEQVEKMPEHMYIASEMGKDILSGFNIEQQNEMLVHIKDMIVNSRQLEIEEIEKKVVHLKESINNL